MKCLTVSFGFVTRIFVSGAFQIYNTSFMSNMAYSFGGSRGLILLSNKTRYNSPILPLIVFTGRQVRRSIEQSTRLAIDVGLRVPPIQRSDLVNPCSIKLPFATANFFSRNYFIDNHEAWSRRSRNKGLRQARQSCLFKLTLKSVFVCALISFTTCVINRRTYRSIRQF